MSIQRAIEAQQPAVRPWKRFVAMALAALVVASGITIVDAALAPTPGAQATTNLDGATANTDIRDVAYWPSSDSFYAAERSGTRLERFQQVTAASLGTRLASDAAPRSIAIAYNDNAQSQASVYGVVYGLPGGTIVRVDEGFTGSGTIGAPIATNQSGPWEIAASAGPIANVGGSGESAPVVVWTNSGIQADNPASVVAYRTDTNTQIWATNVTDDPTNSTTNWLPYGVATSGNFAYVVTQNGTNSSQILKINLGSGEVVGRYSLLGNGTLPSQKYASMITIDPNGEFAYITGNAPYLATNVIHRVRINTNTMLTTGYATWPENSTPTSLEASADGKLYVGYSEQKKYAVISPADYFTSNGSSGFSTRTTSAAPTTIWPSLLDSSSAVIQTSTGVASPYLATKTPTNLKATAGTVKVTLSWKPNDFGTLASEYQIRYRIKGDSSWTTVTQAHTGADNANQSKVIGSLQGDKTYEFQIQAKVDGAWSAWSTAVEATPTSNLPGAPTVTATSGVTGKATVSWTEAAPNGSAVTNYRVRYSTSATGPWTLVSDTLAASSRTTEVSGLTNATEYFFEVTAKNSAGWGAAGVSSSVKIGAVPGVVRDLKAAGKSAAADLTWTVPANTGSTAISKYEVQYRKKGATSWSATQTVSNVTAPLQATVSGLENNTEYDFQVRAVNSVGEGKWTQTSTSELIGNAPGPVQDLAATGGDAQAKVTWTKPDSDGGVPLSKYEVQVRVSTETTWSSSTVVNTPFPNPLATTISNLKNGTSYEFRARAVNAKGESSWEYTGSDAGDLITVGVKPGTPKNPTAASGTSGQATVKWEAPDNLGKPTLSEYLVQYRANGTGAWSTPAQSVTGLTATVTGLTNGTKYQFRVAAKNEVGTSDFAETDFSKNPVVVGEVPGAVRELSGKGADSQADLSWKAPASDGGSAII